MKMPITDTEEASFQMAPMIDMVFLLLVFFMCASRIAQQVTMEELDIPVASKGVVPRDRPNRWTINIRKSGHLFSGQRPTTLKKLKQEIKIALKFNKKLKIYLRADADTPHKEVKAVMNAMAAAGVDEFIFGVFTEKSIGETERAGVVTE